MTTITLDQVRSVKRAAALARPMYHAGNQSPEARELEKAWDIFYAAIYRAETAAMAAEQMEALKAK